MVRWSVWLCLVVCIVSCGDKPNEIIRNGAVEPSKTQVLARVFDSELHISDMPIVSAAATNATDSADIIRRAIDRWIKEQLFLREATKNIPVDLDINKLVEDYRTSLIRHYFEEKLINTKLDTVITDFDLKEHFKKNESLYTLENSILRCLYLKIRKPVPSSKRLEKWLEAPKSTELDALRSYCMNNAEYCLVNPDKWYQWNDIKKSFPKSFKSSSLKKGTKISSADFSYQYYIHILEYVSKKNDAPFSYIEERATKLIIRERKNRLLTELKEQLYEEQKESRNVEIFIK